MKRRKIKIDERGVRSGVRSGKVEGPIHLSL